MAQPSQNTQIVAQGLAWLTGEFASQPNIRAWLAVLLQPWQDLENATWGVLTARFLRTATVYQLPQTNVVFDVIGQLVGQVRGALSDLQLKTLIYLRIAVNRATGRTTDWSRFAQILNPYCDTPPIFYGDQAGIYFGLWHLTLDALSVVASLDRAPPNGVYLHTHYSTWTDGNDFMWGSRYSASAGQGAWGSRYSSSAGGLWVAGAT